MLWAGKLIRHVMTANLANAYRFSSMFHETFHHKSFTTGYFLYIMVYMCGVQYFLIPGLEDCGNWQYGNTTKSGARQLLETFVCNNLTQNSEINYTELGKSRQF